MDREIVDALFPVGWVPLRAFLGVVQGDKLRPIDDGRTSELNRAFAANNQLNLQELDACLAMTKTAMKRSVPGELERVTRGRLCVHKDWIRDGPLLCGLEGGWIRRAPTSSWRWLLRRNGHVSLCCTTPASPEKPGMFVCHALPSGSSAWGVWV